MALRLGRGPIRAAAAAQQAAGFRLRKILGQGKCIAVPGAFNGLTGRMVADKGFDAAYISGGALSAAAGVPDIGVLTLDHFARVIKEVSMASGLPLVADADTGFGEEEMVRRTVHEYALAGAGALHIEDQVFPKRCGHLDGKELIPTARFCGKVERARDAAEATGTGFVVCARTDARGTHGFDEAVTRASEAVRAGAEMIFPESLANRDEFAAFAAAMRKLPGPHPDGGPFMLANMTEFGKTEYITTEDYGKLGYDLVIYPVTLLRAAMFPVLECLDTLKSEGSVETFVPRMFPRKDMYASLRYTPGKEWVYPGRDSE